ncbi:cob(I)yrinic acid a,c-diamide adenosyltransferase [Desulfogranum marinum]|uniref:cob(I)yrinic acid a,c-diamide adenosyltransferase n=1 Tax=Desulfogranum marinum TaxID=453220 RepID=UPI0029C6CABE|nr:cob(I)yrinic acid a,c-diamide adenosyltransferase [Desulfogranum marinum]
MFIYWKFEAQQENLTIESHEENQQMAIIKKGLLLVFTGNGKGKTTSAIGLSIRAAGNNMPICFIQFIKGSWKYGELDALKRFDDLIDFHVMGRGFTWKSDDLEKDKALARCGWEKAKEAISSGKYKMVVLDEFTYLLKYGMLEKEEVLQVLKNKPEDVHLVITGRDALPEIIDAADLVTEMQAVKHPYKSGIKAQKGIEF